MSALATHHPACPPATTFSSQIVSFELLKYPSKAILCSLLLFWGGCLDFSDQPDVHPSDLICRYLIDLPCFSHSHWAIARASSKAASGDGGGRGAAAGPCVSPFGFISLYLRPDTGGIGFHL